MNKQGNHETEFIKLLRNNKNIEHVIKNCVVKSINLIITK